jgi:hypothetical protein
MSGVAIDFQEQHLKANRSFIVQALVRRLQQETEGLSSDQLLQMFFDSYLKRPLAKAPALEHPDLATAPSSKKPSVRRSKRNSYVPRRAAQRRRYVGHSE